MRLARLSLYIALFLASQTACDKKITQREKKLTRGGDKPAVIMVGAAGIAKNVDGEVEPNNEVAQVLQPGMGIVGILDGSDDVDRYSLVAGQTGLLFVTVEGGGKADPTLNLLDASGTVLAKSDRGPAGTMEGLAGYGVEAGSTYQLVVGEFVGRKARKAGGRPGESAPYQLRWHINEDAEAEFEREPNADSDGASEILSGETRNGFLGWSRDVDLWRMPVAGYDDIGAGPKRALHIVLTPPPGVAPQLSLLSASGEVISERRAGKGQELAIRNLLPSVGADFYLLRVTGKPSNPEAHYALRIDVGELRPGTEREPNDSSEAATPIAGDEAELLVVRGDLSLGDIDFFRIAAASHDRVLELQLRGPSHADLDVSVVAESGAILASSAIDSVGTPEALTSVPVAAGQAPLLRVLTKTVQGTADYELTMSLVRGSVTSIAQPVDPLPME